MLGQGLDRWEGLVTPNCIGQWTFQVEGWSDPLATWLHDAEIKLANNIDTYLVLATGAELFEQAAANHQASAAARQEFAAVAATLAQAANQTATAAPDITPAAALAAVQAISQTIWDNPLRQMLTASPPQLLRVVRERALVGAWYEVFPRSLGASFSPATGWQTGTLRTAIDHLDRIADMGFDVLYLTPIHPIGSTFRKGRNNALEAQSGDPGSPYAIGSAFGGHDAIEPSLGTFADFDALVARARQLGMEVALDLALQCSPDHPWVTQHPQWFSQRLDGSIAYAENPPKKYQDIYPLNFDNDPEGIYQAIIAIIRLWMSHGVRIFRVDNPHTKPLAFWERLIAEIATTDPDVIFLAEAFTRPPMMHTLAMIGFHQSYTYFAWRNTKDEVLEYLSELAGEWGSVMRPALWPTTHDILTPFMQWGGQAAFVIRAILAATGAPTWGIYSGYELVENVARPGSEEQIDNEKYQFKPRDFSTPQAVWLAQLLGQLNAIRNAHPALRRLRNLTIHPTSDDATVCFSRRVAAEDSPTGQADVVLVVLSLDPHNTREGVIYLDLDALGLAPAADGGSVAVAHDELSGASFEWNSQPYVRLDPSGVPAHILTLDPQ
jgi:starch synthase (maltosyl-transferring)